MRTPRTTGRVSWGRWAGLWVVVWESGRFGQGVAGLEGGLGPGCGRGLGAGVITPPSIPRDWRKRCLAWTWVWGRGVGGGRGFEQGFRGRRPPNPCPPPRAGGQAQPALTQALAAGFSCSGLGLGTGLSMGVGASPAPPNRLRRPRALPFCRLRRHRGPPQRGQIHPAQLPAGAQAVHRDCQGADDAAPRRGHRFGTRLPDGEQGRIGGLGVGAGGGGARRVGWWAGHRQPPWRWRGLLCAHSWARCKGATAFARWANAVNAVSRASGSSRSCFPRLPSLAPFLRPSFPPPTLLSLLRSCWTHPVSCARSRTSWTRA